jgi:hypothetical protein
MKTSTNEPGVNIRNVGSIATKKANMPSLFRKISLLILLAFISAMPLSAQITMTLSTPTPVSPGSICPGSVGLTIYQFRLVASGIPSLTTQLTGITFSQVGTAVPADIAGYELWSDRLGGPTLESTSGITSFSSFTNFFSGLGGTTIDYWIIANLSPTATAGHVITVAPLTTADFITTMGLRTTFGTIAAGGSQTVLLGPPGIIGTPTVCVGAINTLSDGVTGGVWSSASPSRATINPGTGVVTGVSAGTSVITYQLSTGCRTSRTISINPLPTAYSVTGGGSYCTGGTGVHVGLSGSETGVYYQLYVGTTTSGDPAGTGSALDFGLQTAAGTYTAIATNVSTGCSSTMSGSATVNINPLPNAYTVTGGGDYCTGTPGLHVGLSGSDVGVNYRLYIGSTPMTGTVAGTGSALDFGIFTTVGTYRVVSTNASTGCTKDMTGTVDIAVNPLPNVYNVFGGGDYCAGGAGVHVRLTWSQAGIVYVLYNGSATVGSPIPGTGILLDLGLQTAPGTYTVVALNATTGCTRNMTGSATVVVDPLPPAYTVTGGGNYCAGDSGRHVGLTWSDTGVMYILYNGTTIVGGSVSGTASALDLGLHTAAGTYTVVAVNSATTCINNMAGHAIINVNPLPVAYSVTGGGAYCADDYGVPVGLSNSNTGIDYQLYRGTATVGTALPGTGSPISFGLETAAGTYRVVATNHTTMCTENMSGNAVVQVNPIPPAHNITGGGYYCTGATGGLLSSGPGSTPIHIGLDGSDVGIAYILYNGLVAVGDAINGTGGALDFGIILTAGTYTVVGMNVLTLCTNNMTGSTTININPVVTPSVSVNTSFGSIACQGTNAAFTTTSSSAGSAPSYEWKVNGTTVGHLASYSYVPVNGDVVMAIMTSSEFCAVPATVNNSLTVTTIAPVTPSVLMSTYPGTHIMKGTPVTLTANTTDGGTSPAYLWTVNGSTVVGVTTQTFTTSTLNNSDVVSCTVTRNDACQMTASGSVVITVSDVATPQVTAPNSDVTVVPNPSNGTFTVSGLLNTTGSQEVTLDVTTMVGQVIYKDKVVVTNGILNEQIKLSNTAAGMYILNVHTASENKAIHINIQ